MTEGRIGPEVLADFLNGRLSKEERARVIQKLAESPEDYEQFIDSAEGMYPETHAEHVERWEEEERWLAADDSETIH